MLISPAAIGPLPDDERHKVVFAPDLSIAYFCSEPKLVKCMSMLGLDERLAGSWTPSGPDLRTVAKTTATKMLEICSSDMRRTVDQLRDRYGQRIRLAATSADLPDETVEVILDLLVTREIARIELGAEFLIAQPSVLTMADINAAPDLA